MPKARYKSLYFRFAGKEQTGPFVHLRKWKVGEFETLIEDYVLEYGVRNWTRKDYPYPLLKSITLDVSDEWLAINQAINVFAQLMNNWTQIDDYEWVPKETQPEEDKENE